MSVVASPEIRMSTTAGPTSSSGMGKYYASKITELTTVRISKMFTRLSHNTLSQHIELTVYLLRLVHTLSICL